ncbi:helix-turn-helix transcriptional regulator [Streptomyces agglomeratus]|uniref:helix-turn-helix transcriptional regulator n=1 Tax=Streptomyces agglomeratus TaxID=285458 RepID=UPI000854356E|nr:LuxR family transcriptional regulator [Streptomyces agglomeratus]OEJ41985.1 helix-turn-helix transcriptional regulator [Streptomyces agglomeratus]OEJ43637.1 helix-turn-helix transcriptional regulator [Streptomyces agglomeratus]OEJ61846.1 helix-turn-helix transcriptional regulator [Streptomyces agglomeratus]
MTSAVYRPAPVGRAELLARLERVLHSRGRALLTGPAGVGKTELALAAAARAESRGEAVIWLATLPADRDIPGAAAAALVASVAACVSWPAAGTAHSGPGGPGDPAGPGTYDLLDGLPGPQRTAVAMLCREALIPDGGWDAIALRLGLAQILRTLAARGPVLLVVDGVQRVDDTSADLVRFALHLAPPALRVLAVETPSPYGSEPSEGGTPRPDPAAGPEPLWVPSEADVLFVPPLQADEIAELLIHHRLPSRMAGRIHRASGGNPRLALAVGRSLADARTPVHHAEALSLSGRARDLARQLLGAASPGVRATLLLAALALRPTASLIRRAGRPTAEADLAAAERANLVSLDEDGTVGFTAGVLPSTLVHDACWTERSAGHAALARVVDDPVEEVRHRALATDIPDGALAAEVADAADVARRRGNSALAAELALLAAESTPVQHGAKRIARLVDAAEEAARAARADLAMRAATDLLARDAAPADRVRARLAVLDTAGQGLCDLEEIYVHAMEDSEGDTALRAAVQLRLAVKYVLADGDPVRSRAAAVESAALAGSVGDRRTAARALTVQARMDRVLGSPDAERVLAEARALEVFERPLGIRNAAQILTIRHALFDDRLTDARDQVNALLPLVERRGPVEDAIELFRTLAEIGARQGQCATALAHAGRSLALTLEAGLSPGPAWYALALAETAGGSFERAASYARRSVRASEEEGDHVFLSRSRYALGRVQLINGDVASALESLRRVQADERAQSTVDPSMLRWHEELAEALLANDAPEEAAALLAGVRPVAERLGRTTVLLGCDRAYALYLAASGKPDEAADLLSRTADSFAAAGLPLESGRALIALARVERRRRRRSAAQSALHAAAAVFERAGAVPWLGLTTETSSRTAEPAPARGENLSSLTDAELRLALLVGQGASNQEAAAKLYLSVKTVEARLTRIYQKLDVRSRAQLATALTARQGHLPASAAAENPAAG